MPVALPLSDQTKLQAFVDRRHPTYNEHLGHWRFCEETFKGGRQWFTANIHGYLKEGTREYADRLARAYRFNHTKEVVQLVTKYIFKAGVIRNLDNAPLPVKKFWQCATLDGDPIDALMKQISNQSSTQGRVYCVIDSRNTGEAPVTLADEKAGKTRTYAYLVKITDVLDFAKDDLGNFTWILYKTKYRDDADPVNSTGQVRTRYVLWTLDEWIILEEQLKQNTEAGPSVSVITSDPANASMIQSVVTAVLTDAQAQAMAASQAQMARQIVLIDRGPNKLGEIPIVQCDHVENNEHYCPPSLIDDIAYLDRACANYLSNLDAIIQDQTFSQLAMPAQGLLPGEDAYDKMLEMGTKRIFVYNGEDGAKPFYIEPDAGQANLIVNVIKTIIGEIYHSVGMAGERTKQDNAAGIDNSSGVAKAYDFDRMNALLVAKASQLSHAESRIAYFVERYSGKDQEDTSLYQTDPDDVESLIKYPDDYDVRGVSDEFDIAQSLMLMQAPDSVRRQQMQAIIIKLFPRLAAALVDKMQTELKDWPVDPMDTLQQQLQITSKFSDGNTGGSVSDKSAPPGGSSGGGSSTPAKKPAPAAKPNTGKKGNRQGENNKD